MWTRRTVGEALGGLTSKFGELKKHLYTDEGKIRSFVNVYLNDEDIRYLQREKTPTKDGDTISIVPSIAGRPKLTRIGSSGYVFQVRRIPISGIDLAQFVTFEAQIVSRETIWEHLAVRSPVRRVIAV